MNQKILVTGGCGKIGAYFVKNAPLHYSIRVADKHPWNEKIHGPTCAEVFIVDLQDFTQCQQICQGMDMVVHLAADANPEADFNDSLLGNNIIATRNMFRAAKDAGCKRFIYASSVHVFSAYPYEMLITEDMNISPGNEYGVSKCFGEALAAYFSHVEGLPTIVLRIGAYLFPEEYANFPTREINAFLDPDDFNQLLIRCLETPNINFLIAHAISNNREKRIELTHTIETLGYHPEVDSFRIFKTKD